MWRSAGCPPDGFSADGQIWGNPLYDWETMAGTDFAWWKQRLSSSFEMYDVVRIDHFRGLDHYYAVPYGAKTAKDGRWKPGPGMNFIKTIQQTMPDARIIAEDLGFLTDSVHELLAASGYPGMKLVQFAFDSRIKVLERDTPESYGPNMVVYPGTHDNDTLKGWCKTAPRESVRDAMAYLGVRRKSDLPAGMIRLALQSSASLAVIPAQDWLGLGSEARMNTPGAIGGNNWRWRLNQKTLTSRLAGRIAYQTALFKRCEGTKVL